MPREMETKLKHRAEAMAKAGKLKRKKGESVKDAVDRYTYGAMRSKMHWNPSREM